jgi:hypothetical protein
MSTKDQDLIDQLRDRVTELRAWALSRIRWCDAEIDRCGLAGGHDAVIERRALRAVLRILDGQRGETGIGHNPRWAARYGNYVLVGCVCGWLVDPEADPEADLAAHIALARAQEGGA